MADFSAVTSAILIKLLFHQLAARARITSSCEQALALFQSQHDMVGTPWILARRNLGSDRSIVASVVEKVAGGDKSACSKRDNGAMSGLAVD